MDLALFRCPVPFSLPAMPPVWPLACVLLSCLLATSSPTLPAVSEFVSKLKEYQIVHVESHHGVNVQANAKGIKVHPRISFMSFHAFETQFEIMMERNDELLSERYRERFVHIEHGKIISETVKTRDQIEHCYYRGAVQGATDSSVAMNMCNGGFQGIVMHNGELFGVEPALKHMTQEVARPYFLSDCSV